MQDLTLNAVSDNWFDRCMKTDNRLLAAIVQAFSRVFQFDCIVTIIYLILIIFPILFKIYGFGIQQRLRNFYNSSRLIIIEFLFLFSFSVDLCTIIHLCIQQPMPCVIWNGRDLSPLTHSSRTPNHELIVVFILCIGVWSLKIGIPLVRRTICVAIVLLECVAAVLSGYSSISQALISLTFGVWIIFLFNFLPPVGIPVIGSVAFVSSCVLFGVTFPKYQWSTALIKTSLHLCARGAISLFISCILLLRFGFAREEFDWHKVSWGLGWKNNKEGSSDDVVIPSMIRESFKDDFGSVLKTDLIVSIIAFILFLICNTLLNLNLGDRTFMLV
jgi:hypothetical protein